MKNPTPNRVLASQLKPKRTGTTKNTPGLNFDAAFDIACAMAELEKKFREEKSKHQQKLIREEIDALGDQITSGKSNFAAQQYRPLVNAALKIFRGSPPTDPGLQGAWRESQIKKIENMTMATLIRELQAANAHQYKNANGDTLYYSERRIRVILKKYFKFERMQCIDYKSKK